MSQAITMAPEPVPHMEGLEPHLQSRLQAALDRESKDDEYLRELESRVADATSDEDRRTALVVSLGEKLARIRESEAGAEDYINSLEERLVEAEQQHEAMTREIERLENQVGKQHTITKLDSILFDLDSLRQINVKSKDVPKRNGLTRDQDTDSFHSFISHGSDSESEYEDDEDTENEYKQEKALKISKSIDVTKEHLEIQGGAVRPINEDEEHEERDERDEPRTPVPNSHPNYPKEKDDEAVEDQDKTLEDDKEELVEEVEDDKADKAEDEDTPEEKSTEEETEQSKAISETKLVNDKLESVIRELFYLRVEHDGSVSEYDALEQKYKSALASLVELQGAFEDPHKSAENGIKEEDEEDTDKVQEELTNGHEEEEKQTSVTTDLNPARALDGEPSSAITSGSQREDELLEENQQLKKQQEDHVITVAELQGNLTQLHDKHQEALEQVEELKADLHRAKGINGRASPNPGILRRKERTSVLSDRANRSFAILRTLVLDRLEGDEERSQTFESNLNMIVTEFHSRSERVVQLESEVGALRKEIEAKTTLINGLTRERSSLKATSPIDMSALMRMESQLRDNEVQMRKLTDSHASREQELLDQIDHIKMSLGSNKSSTSSSNGSEYSRELNGGESQEVVNLLQKEVADWRTKHDSAIESMRASEMRFLSTISDLEHNLKSFEQHASRSVSPDEAHNYGMERQHHMETISRLQKEVADHKAATMLTTQRLAELQESHIKILEQVDRDNQAKALTVRELDSHKLLVGNLENQLKSHQQTIQTHQESLESLKTGHSKELEDVKAESLRAQKESNEKLQAALEEHREATSSLQEEIERARAGTSSRSAILESEYAKHKEQTSNFLSDAAMILNKPTNMSNITAHIQALMNARKDISALHETASNELQALREELEDVRSGTSNADNLLDELKRDNEKMAVDIKSLTEKEKKSSRLVEELEQQLESNYNQSQTKDSKGLEKQLEEARSRIGQLESDLEDARGGDLHRSNSNRSEHANIRKSMVPSPPPTIPLPPLPAGGNPPPTPTVATAPITMSPPQSRHTSKDINTAQLVEDQEARIRTIEKHLFAEKQLTATLEEALTDLESSSTKLKADMEAWRRKCGVLEEELLLLKREKQNTRLSVQQMEDEARRRIDLERAKLEERMQQLTTMSKKQKKKSSINCF